LQPGGDGVRRELEFTREVEVSLLSQRRETRPFGLAGGQPGAAGRAFYKGAGGDSLDVELSGCFQRVFSAGEQLVLETPGGGGYGQPPPPDDAAPEDGS